MCTSKYEEEINFLKTKSTTDSEKKSTLRNETYKTNENGILNTTDGSTFESPFADCSGFHSHKEMRNKYQTLNPSSTTPFNVNQYNSTANITQKIESNIGKTLISKANKRYSDKFVPTATTTVEYKTSLKVSKIGKGQYN